MKVVFRDFNGADTLFATRLQAAWFDIALALTAMPLQLKASDQKGKQGSPIFDPVATNAAIKAALVLKGWTPNIVIPGDLAFLGTDVDFLRYGVLVEAQFSNYPFFLNNVVRSALLAKAQALLAGEKVIALAIITKGHMFPSSNSTLYYEQAVSQLVEFTKHRVFDIPIRVVGLLEDVGIGVPAVWHTYPGRYSRAPSQSRETVCELLPGVRTNSICKIRLTPQDD